MRKYLYPILFFAAVIAGLCLGSGCKKIIPPVTCYDPIADTAYVGQRLDFSSCTIGANSYYWDFGDNGFATTAAATHIYTQPGIYKGTFYASNGEGAHKSFTIIVLRP